MKTQLKKINKKELKKQILKHKLEICFVAIVLTIFVFAFFYLPNEDEKICKESCDKINGKMTYEKGLCSCDAN